MQSFQLLGFNNPGPNNPEEDDAGRSTRPRYNPKIRKDDTTLKLMVRDFANELKHRAKAFGFKKLDYRGTHYLPQRRKLVLKLMADKGFDVEEPDAFSFFGVLLFPKMVDQTEGKVFEEILRDLTKVEGINRCR